MKWFKNLNTMPKLMLSFGLLLAITAGIGYLGISRLQEINQQVETIYARDLLGLAEAKDLEVAKMNAASCARDAILNAASAEIVTTREREIQEVLSGMHAHLENSARYASTPQAKALLQTFRETLPAYEQGLAEVFRKAKAHDQKGAQAALAAFSSPTKTLNQTVTTLSDLKKQLAAGDKAASEAVYKSALQGMIGLIVGAILVGLVMSIWIARLFAKPLAATADMLNKVAEGDLTQRLDLPTKDETGRMAAALNEALESMRSTLSEVTDSADSLSSAAQQLAAASESMASGTQEQAASLEETSASLEEITATVRQNADSAKQASQLATSSRESAEKGGAVVSDAVGAMAEINASSEKIADIIGTVDEIAFQTNLLAVNAAVEAARAGEQGRGFAVVASEVRSLAQRSAAAAKEIKSLIGDSVRKAKNGSDLVNRSGHTLTEIVASVKRVTDIVGEIASASQEQTVGIEQVNKAMIQMDQVTQSNSAQTEELSSTAESLSIQAQGLQQLVSRFVIKSGNGQRGNRQRASEPSQVKPGTAKAKSFKEPAATATLKRPARPQKTALNSHAESLVNLSNSVPSMAVHETIAAPGGDFEEF